MVDGVGTTKYDYTALGQLQTEEGPWASDTVSYTYNNRLRDSLSLLHPSASAWVQGYDYDTARRLTNITSAAGEFTYTLGGTGSASSLTKKLSLPGGSYITNAYDLGARLLSTDLKNSGETVLSSHDYGYNQGNQRTQQVFAAGNYVNYGYDSIGQLESARGAEAGGSTNRLHEQFGYDYDAAGNLRYRTNNALLQTFNVNSRNELSTVTRDGTLTLAGMTTAPATNVIVNDLEAEIYGDNTFARAGIALVDGENEIFAYAHDSAGRVDADYQWLALPATVTFQYDSNGNLTNDGRRALYYNDENQLSAVQVVNVWKSEFEYDGKMRRRVRKEYKWNGSAWQKTNEVRYVYDGNLVIQERDANNVPQVTYTRGTDLSGSIEGAGGIGGLLARTANPALPYESAQAYYHADGNGNVTAMVNTNGVILARYHYDPYGYTLSTSGPLADANLYRFSSKEWHPNSSLVYYLYRYYDPNLQRWINQDPLGELGSEMLRSGRKDLLDDGPNNYLFVHNTPVNRTDPLGLLISSLPIPGNAAIAALSCARRIKNEVWNGFAPGGRVPPSDPSFHYGHCVAHCRIQRECVGGRVTSWLGGVWKELTDEFKQWGGKGAGWESGDMDANREGRKRGRGCKEKSCEQACKGV